MGFLHWFILIPYYFFASLALLPLLIVACRLLRLKFSINALVGTAIAVSVVAIVVSLAGDWLDLAHFRGGPLLALGVASMLLAALDAALMGALPLPLDKELQDL